MAAVSFDPTEGSPATKAQMLKLILIREMEAATSEDDLRVRLAGVCAAAPIIEIAEAERRVARYLLDRLLGDATRNWVGPRTVELLKETAASMAKDALGEQP